MNRLQIGADPEFAYRQGSRSVNARQYQNMNGAWGTDGRADTAELRPGYSNNVVDLVSKIHHLMKLVARHPHIGNLKWCAGQYVDGKPLGGHIHISHPNWSISLTNRIVNVLDGLLLEGVSPTLEVTSQRNNRSHHKMDKYRSDHTYDSGGGLEYRECGSWLISPEVALAYLGVAKAGAAWAVSNPRGSTGFSGRLNNIHRAGTLSDRVLSVCDALKYIGDHIDLPSDCRYAVETYRMLGAVGVDWNEDMRDTWAVFD